MERRRGGEVGDLDGGTDERRRRPQEGRRRRVGHVSPVTGVSADGGRVGRNLSESPHDSGVKSASYTRTSSLPRLRPWNSSASALGAFSNPSTMSSAAFSRP